MRAARTIIADTIADRLGASIVSGGYAVGATVPGEADLCGRHRASRTAVREAVKMLLAKGLLAIRPRLGARVRPEGEWNVLDPDVLRWMLARDFSLPLLLEFTDLRLAVEPGAAALAALRADQSERAALRETVAAMFDATRRDEAAFLAADIAFHMSVLAASHNRFYAGLKPMIETALRFSIRRTGRQAGSAATAQEHARIADTILSGDPAASSDAMRALILATREKIAADMRATRHPLPLHTDEDP